MPAGLEDDMDQGQENLPKKETKFTGTVRPLEEADIAFLQPILKIWIRFPTITGELLTEEVRETMDEMHQSVEGENNKKYFVAQAPDGTITGVMGLQPLGEKMMPFVHTHNPAEIINAYVHFDERQGKGVGKALVTKIEEAARAEGYEEVLLNSGPRYKDTGWPFWRKMYGEPAGLLKNHYGTGFDAPVWRKVL